MNEVTVNFFLDTRLEKKNGKYPLKLTIYFLEDKERFKTGIDLTENEWKKNNQPKLRDNDLKDVRISMNAIKKKAEDLIKELDEDFTFEEFRRLFATKREDHKTNSFLILFKAYIDALKVEERLTGEITDQQMPKFHRWLRQKADPSFIVL